MTLIRDLKNTVALRIRTEPTFAQALLNEAVALFFKGEVHSARVIVRDLVNAIAGLDGTAEEFKLDQGDIAALSHEEATIQELKANPEEATAYLRSVLADGDVNEVLLALKRLTSTLSGA